MAEREIFAAAIRLAGEQREAFLREACGQNAALRGQVDALLKAHEASVGWLPKQTDRELADTLAPSPVRAGTLIGGRYKLLENIGEGGMGAVWIADQQTPVKRKVAIKFVKAGMDSQQVLARFEAERQALAMMDHPHIAKVFDGGLTDQGRPYFVMENVKGLPFTQYCDRASLSIKERLQLFIPVCQAIQHAHHKGIVHRDLKPSNVLICLYDGVPVPKVIDFGLAKALHQSLTEQTLHTSHGVMVGTPLYMSPEQAEYNNLDVDTRTDVYSLGVLLYEILTGTTPLERQQLQTAAYEEVLRLIKEVEPLRPSLRLSGSASLPSIAAQRRIDPRELRRSLAGDLDWIVMKALEKERSRRYETANGLARDIERFLNEEAVEACPPSSSYRLKKFLRKHKGKVAIASSVFAILVIGIAGTTWGLWRATKAEDAATASKLDAMASEQKTLVALGEVEKERDAKEEQRKLAEAARETAERQLIGGILRAIGYAYGETTAELRAFFEWSSIPDQRLRIKVLEQGLDDPEIALGMARQAHRCIQASVAISPSARTRAIGLVSTKQRDREADPRIRAAACWLALELGSSDLPALNESIAYLSGPTINPYDGNSAPWSLAALAPRLTDEQASQVSDALITLLRKTSDSSIVAEAGLVLAALAARLTNEQATYGWDALTGVLERSTAGDVAYVTAQALAALAEKLTEEQAWHHWNALIMLTAESTDPYVSLMAVSGLASLVPRLAGDKVSLASDGLVALVVKSSDSHVLEAAAKEVSKLAMRMTNEGEQPSQVADTLIAVLEKFPHTQMSVAAASGLTALAPRLTGERASHAWNASMAESATLENWYDIESHVLLTALAPRLTDEQVSHYSHKYAAVLSRSSDEYELVVASVGLAALAPRLSGEEALHGWNAFVAVFERNSVWVVLAAARRGITELASTVADDQARHGVDVLIVVLKRQSNQVWEASSSLAALAPRMTDEQVSLASDALVALVSSDVVASSSLDALAARMTDEQVSLVSDALIAVLVKSSTSDGAKSAASSSLAALAPRMTEEQVLRSSHAIVATLKKLPSRFHTDAAARGLEALAPRLPSELTSLHWNSLIAHLDHEPFVAARGLSILAPYPTDSDVLRGGDALIAHLKKSTDWPEPAADLLASLTPRLSTNQCVRAAEILLWSLGKKGGGVVTKALARVITRLDATSQERIGSKAMATMLDQVFQYSNYYTSDLTATMSNARSLAAMLSHPGCIGGTRDGLLMRFEELVLYNGDHVLLAVPNAEGPQADADHLKPKAARRRFQNLHDAADWIQHNWPDFDLEAVQPLTWRG